MTNLRLSIDQVASAAYIQLTDEEFSRTIEVSPSCFVDLDELDRAIGVELLLPVTVSYQDILDRVHISSEYAGAVQQALAAIPQYSMTSSSLTSHSRLEAKPLTGFATA